MFLPMRKSTKQWSDRRKILETPLFPGYVFCRFSPDRFISVLATPGVIDILRTGNRLHFVEDHEIAALQRVVTCGIDCEPCAYIETGQRVRVDHGPLRGVEGVVLRSKTNYRLVLSVNLLQRSVAAEVPRGIVSPVEEEPGKSRMLGSVDGNQVHVRSIGKSA